MRPDIEAVIRLVRGGDLIAAAQSVALPGVAADGG
jgi:hypothetical protein